jgi:hypothetical protein
MKYVILALLFFPVHGYSNVILTRNCRQQIEDQVREQWLNGDTNNVIQTDYDSDGILYTSILENGSSNAYRVWPFVDQDRSHNCTVIHIDDCGP